MLVLIAIIIIAISTTMTTQMLDTYKVQLLFFEQLSQGLSTSQHNPITLKDLQLKPV